ncbi:MAG: EAL domain-containing protein [Gammaproteobacteria bacterium]|nr:EAL domain-containing protein [Gammaproteobacteria bacterium]
MKVVDPVNLNSVDPASSVPDEQCDSAIELKSANTSKKHRESMSTHHRTTARSSSLVLVADDDPMIRLLAHQTLTDKSFEVLQAEDGRHALELFKAEEPDLVLCDVMMPEIDGFELCTSIRAMKQGEHVPIVMLTGLNDAKSIKQAFSIGATDFCEKPVNWELLPYKLDYILRASSTFSELQVSEERYSLVAHGANDGLWDWDYTDDRVYFSPRWKFMLGFTEDAIGHDPLEWIDRIHADDKSHVINDLHAHKIEQTSHFECEYRIKNAEGDYRWMVCRGLAVRNEDGVAYRMIGSQSDINDRKQAEEKLVFDAVHDALTGLPNRILFLDRLNHCIELSSRRKNFSFAILYLDLNRFKIINDSLGHLLGDQLLVEIGSRIKLVIRKGDTLSRLGGDEFVILCEEIEDITVATNLADRIHEELLRPIDLDGQKVVVGCSIGITDSSIGYQRPEDMLRDADAAMYRAKVRTGSRYEIFDISMHKKAMNVLRIESDLRLALEKKQFEVHYQPIVEIEEDVVSGFEALVRWNHPKQGMLIPEEFLEVAIESRLIVPLGRWVLKQACRQMQTWKEHWEEAKDWTISVNLSAPELAQPDLVGAMNEIIDESGLDPNFLKLEITETSLVKNSSHALETMNALRERGIHLSIDDFGTGYSSFSYLHQFPFDELKIDRTFISELDNRSDKQQIVNAIVSLAHNLGMTVVAEGSASGAIYENLRGASCEYAQGFSIMQPKSASEITRSIAVDVDRTEITSFSTS